MWGTHRAGTTCPEVVQPELGFQAWVYSDVTPSAPAQIPASPPIKLLLSPVYSIPRLGSEQLALRSSE